MTDIAPSTDPSTVRMLLDRASVATRIGDHALAATLYRAALAVEPNVATTHVELADSLMHLNDFAGAMPHCRSARELDPASARCAFNLGRALEGTGDAHAALEQYRAADALAPHHSGTLVRMAKLLREAGRPEEAAAYLAPVVEREPENVPALFELAFAHERQNRFEEAASLYARAASLDPDSAGIVNNLAFSLLGLARYREAEALFRRALKLDPGLHEAAFQLGMLLLQRGDYAHGWPLYERRKLTAANASNYRRLPCAEWQGEPLAGKRILLAREQGAGDGIQFIRYASLLAARGAHVHAWVAPELLALMRTVPGVMHAIDAAPDDDVIASQYDFWCDTVSLPSRLPGETVPAAARYMRADPARASAWRERVHALAPCARRRVGLVWAGNPRHRFDAYRSLSLHALLPLATVADTAWFAIQKGPAAAQSAEIASGWPMHAVGDALHDFSDTAALVESLDLVITVDTSVAHLAGALGKPVWILLAAHTDWRWGIDASVSAWYPSARLFRQKHPGDWRDVSAELLSQLDAGPG
ncbi:tetratricopeptide repeat protein [Caballeronia cordobensis]|uniref:tetratricopeptide repeat protein n=1 Tax=Caballeronia cordobensis TaxID=1353886 RepID=UPI00045EF5CD|nr:TPR repeat-containing protein [Burkholderia sp. RPE67]